MLLIILYYSIDDRIKSYVQNTLQLHHIATWQKKYYTEHSYLAVEEIIKRVNESKQNLQQFCRVMNTPFEEGMMSIVPVPNGLMAEGQCLKKALMDLKKIKKQWYCKNKYICWVLCIENGVLTTKFFKQIDLKVNSNLLDPSTNLIGIYIVQKYQIQTMKPLEKQSRNRFISMKRRSKSKCMETKNVRSLSSINPKTSISSLKKSHKTSQRLIKSHSFGLKPKPSSLKNNYTTLTTSSFKVSSSSNIIKKPRFSVTYKPRNK